MVSRLKNIASKPFYILTCLALLMSFSWVSRSVAGDDIPAPPDSVVLVHPTPLVAPRTHAIPAGGESLFPKPGIDMLPVGDLGKGYGTSEKVQVEGQPFKEALLLTTLKETSQKWDVNADCPIPQATFQGDVILAEFWLKATQSRVESGEAKTEFVFERLGDPWTKAVEYAIPVGPQWKKYSIPFECVEDLPAGKAHICFRMGYGPQAYELAGLKLTNYGTTKKIDDLPKTKSTYEGMEPTAPWRKEAQARIEKFRKGDLSVVVKDAQGNPVSGAQVLVDMKRQAFGFGSCVVAGRLAGTGPDNDRYRKEVERLFNKVVFENDLKWGFWEQGATNSGGWSRQSVLDSLKWLSDRHIAVRGHNMVWGGWQYIPADVQQVKGDPKALEKAIEHRIQDVGTAMKGKVVEWDVVNEPYPEHQLTDIFGKQQLVTWYKKARQADPTALLFVNDYPTPDNEGHLAGDEAVIKLLQDNKAPLGGYGLQGHIGGSPWSMPDLLKTLDRFGAYGIPVEITEFDTQIMDDELDAQFMKDFLTAVYSHPSTNGFIMWGFWDGAQWNHKAPIFNEDWTEKPSGKALEQLMFHDWWTNASGKTDAEGSYQTRGFTGDYEVTVKSGGKTVTVPAQLTKEGLTLPVVLK